MVMTDAHEGPGAEPGSRAGGQAGGFRIPPLRPVPAADVDLAPDSRFGLARERVLRLAREYPVDRVLAVFREAAGLDTLGAAPPGNWEDHGHPEEVPWGEEDYPGREKARTANLLRGHYAGHFLSMLAKAHASTGEELIRERAHAMVEGLAEVQAALAETGRYSHPGFLAAYGEWQFSRLERLAPYGEIWAPYYTAHKIMAGLLDAHEHTGSDLALEVLEGMARWIHHRLSRVEPAQRQRMWSLYIAGEFGGIGETLARLAALTGDAGYLETARMFDQEALLEAGSEGRDVLDGMHANQHLPQLIAYVHDHALTGDERYIETAITLFDQVVPGRMYAHGGSGEGELWGPAGSVAGDIGHRNAETCVAYNLVKLARLLLERTGEEKYADYIERALTNQVLGSRRAVDSATSPEVTYMFPVHPGALREYDNVGTCCGGTGLENHVTYEESVALAGPDELRLVLLTDATIRWREQGVTLRVATDGLLGGRVVVDIVDAPEGGADVVLSMRIPRWAGAAPRLHLEPAGAAADTPVGPLLRGEFHPVQRRWCIGDRILLELPVGVSADPTPDDPDLHSLSVGRTVMLARSERSTELGLPLRGLRRLDGMLVGVRWKGDVTTDSPAPLLGLEGIDGIDWEPAWSGSDSRYHMYVRAADEQVAFAGHPSGVPERAAADGSTLLAEVWAEPSPRTRETFLERVLDVVAARAEAGLLSPEEARRVLTAAVEADIDDPEAVARPEAGVGNESGEDARLLDEMIARLPEVDPRRIPPTVRIMVEPSPGPSGWFTIAPMATVEVNGGAPAGGSDVELRADDQGWQPVTGPLQLADGEHRLEARVRTAGGLEGRAVRTVDVDTAPPVSEARVKDLGSAWEITLVAEDEISGVDRIQWEGPGTFWGTFHEAFVRTLTDEEQVIEFAATDRAGNQERRRRLVLPARRN